MVEKKENIKKDMLLESPSGFTMPFAGDEEHDVEVSLAYGEQRHPATGEPFQHSGIDLVCSHQPLFAVASGTVIGVGTDAIHENYIVIRYGKYDVKYGHISAAYCQYGTRVVAGQQVAVSGDFLHLGVRFSGQLIDPVEFLQMLYSNVITLSSLGMRPGEQPPLIGAAIRTDYDKDQDEIVQLMLQWLPEYMNALRTGAYVSSPQIADSLRNVFRQGAERNYFYEEIPSLANPLGLGGRSSLLAGKVQSLLIGDFLNFLGSRHQLFPSSWGDEEKKKLALRFQKTG